MSQPAHEAAMPVPHEALKDRARAWFESLRDQLCAEFEAIEDAQAGPLADQPAGRFTRTAWQRPAEGHDGGGGVMSVMRGRVFEKVGVNVSTVAGEFSPEFRAQIQGAEQDPRFWASGISLVAHMQSPLVPAAHFNTRMLITTKGWFGGGGDLTPMRLETPEAEADAADFHASLKAACDRHNPKYYPDFKAWCDRYFFLPHRNETRGVGGLFFDDLNEGGFERSFGFLRSVGDHFLPAYMPIIERRKDQAFDERERRFQLYRRGRYVEFNLVYDRGTLFGLQSRGRTESILMSMPPLARWDYDWHPEPGSPEARLYQDFLRPRDYLAELDRG